MNFFRYCDLFNIKFHFFFKNKDDISLFGGLMSLIYIILAILITVMLSIDDFQKLNPITTKSEIPGGEFREVNLKESHIYIPWRLITYEEKFIDHRGILYPMVTLIEGKLNEEIGMDLKTHNLKYTLCNETSMANISYHYKIDTPLNEVFCIEQNDIPFGGSWLGDSLYYLEVNLFLCEDGIRYNASDSRCTLLPDIVDYVNSTWLFEFFYPIVQFQPTNHEDPMMVIYKNYYYRITSHSYKLERLYIQENILSDDMNLFQTSSKNYSLWGISTIYGDSYYWSEEQDPLVKSNSSVLFSLDIYMDQGCIYYTRSYRKIFEIFSNVFPVLNVLLIVFEKMTIWIKSVFANKEIANILFEKTKITKKKYKFNINNDKNSYNIDKPRNTIFLNKMPKFEEAFKISKFKIKNDKLNLIKSLNNDNNSAYKEINYNIKMKKPSEISKDESHLELFNSFKIKKHNKSKEKNRISFNNKNKKKEEETNYKDKDKNKEEYITKKKNEKLFPLYYFFFDKIISKLDRPKNFCCLDKKFLIVYNFIGRIFDISSYIILFKDFSIYRTILDKEMKHLNFDKLDKKFNINNIELMHNLEQKIFSYDSDDNNIFSKTILYH